MSSNQAPEQRGKNLATIVSIWLWVLVNTLTSLLETLEGGKERLVGAEVASRVRRVKRRRRRLQRRRQKRPRRRRRRRQRRHRRQRNPRANWPGTSLINCDGVHPYGLERGYKIRAGSLFPPPYADRRRTRCLGSF